VIEQKLFVMYLEHRMRTFQGAFHASPDYALWYGWSEMQEIKELAEEMRRSREQAAPRRRETSLIKREPQRLRHFGLDPCGVPFNALAEKNQFS
jgi:hypothetical protein